MSARRRPPRKVDPNYLRRVAVWYLERWQSPPSGLRRILMKRVRASVTAHDTDPEEAAEWVEDVVQEAIRAGLTSDDAYAEMMVRRGRSAGRSARAIRARLRAKGVDPDAIDRALAELDADIEGDAELVAGLRYARRRRFGPWRRRLVDADGRRREMASMARQGFSYELVRRVVDWPPDALEDAEDHVFQAVL